MLRYLAKNTQKYSKLSLGLIRGSVANQRYFCFDNRDPFKDENHIDFMADGPKGFRRFDRETKKKSENKNDPKKFEEKNSQEEPKKVEKKETNESKPKKQADQEEKADQEKQAIEPEVIVENESEKTDSGKVSGFDRFARSSKKTVKKEANDQKPEKNNKKPSIIGLKQDFEDMLKKSFEDDEKKPKKDDNNLEEGPEKTSEDPEKTSEEKNTEEKSSENEKRPKRESVYGMKGENKDKSSKNKNFNKIFNDKSDSNDKDNKEEDPKDDAKYPWQQSLTSANL